MSAILISLPDAKFAQGKFTEGKTYQVLGSVGNAYKVMSDVGTDGPHLVLQNRFKEERV